MTNDQPPQVPKFIRRLMAGASEQELLDATENFKRYMAVVRRIYERVTSERLELDSSEKQRFGRIRDDDHVV
jgi:hypothetical protein